MMFNSSMMSTVGAIYLISLLLPILVFYLVALVRDRQKGLSEPQLGLRFGMYFFQSVGLHLILIALAVTIGMLLSGAVNSFKYFRVDEFRVPGGMVLSGVLVMLFSRFVFVRAAGEGVKGGITSLFAGANWIITSLVAFGGLVAFAFWVVMGRYRLNDLVPMVAVLVVYLPACIVFSQRLKKENG